MEVRPRSAGGGALPLPAPGQDLPRAIGRYTELVLIGGAISLISAISITAVTTLLNHWLDRRRDARKLRADLLRALGRNTALVGGQQGLTDDALAKLYEAAKARGIGRSTTEDLAFDLGFSETLTEILQEGTKT